jgi:hypothetical protein
MVGSFWLWPLRRDERFVEARRVGGLMKGTMVTARNSVHVEYRLRRHFDLFTLPVPSGDAAVFAQSPCDG